MSDLIINSYQLSTKLHLPSFSAFYKFGRAVFWIIDAINTTNIQIVTYCICVIFIRNNV